MNEMSNNTSNSLITVDDYFFFRSSEIAAFEWKNISDKDDGLYIYTHLSNMEERDSSVLYFYCYPKKYPFKNIVTKSLTQIMIGNEMNQVFNLSREKILILHRDLFQKFLNYSLSKIDHKESYLYFMELLDDVLGANFSDDDWLNDDTIQSYVENMLSIVNSLLEEEEGYPKDSTNEDQR